MNRGDILLIGLLACAAYVAVARWIKGRDHRKAADLETEKFQREYLFIVLRESPFDVQPDEMDVVARAAWSDRFGDNPDGTNFVERYVPAKMYVLVPHGNAFVVTAMPKADRALPPPEVFLPESARRLWDNYTDDVSIGIVYNFDTDPVRLSAYITTLTAQLCDEHSLAVYHKASRRLWKLTDDLRSQLAAGSSPFF